MSQLALSAAPRAASTGRLQLALMVGGFVLLWASAFAVGKIAIADCPPLIFLAVRFLTASAIMMAFAAATGRWTVRQVQTCRPLANPFLG